LRRNARNDTGPVVKTDCYGGTCPFGGLRPNFFSNPPPSSILLRRHLPLRGIETHREFFEKPIVQDMVTAAPAPSGD